MMQFCITTADVKQFLTAVALEQRRTTGIARQASPAWTFRVPCLLRWPGFSEADIFCEDNNSKNPSDMFTQYRTTMELQGGKTS